MKITVEYLKEQADILKIVPERMSSRTCVKGILAASLHLPQFSDNQIIASAAGISLKELLQLEGGFEGWWATRNPFSRMYRVGRKFYKLSGGCRKNSLPV